MFKIPFNMVLENLNHFNFLSLYPILIKYISKCMISQDISSQVYYSPTLRFPLKY